MSMSMVINHSGFSFVFRFCVSFSGA
jgi:hypothetical protein